MIWGAIAVVVIPVLALIGELWLHDWWLSRREPKADRRNWTPPR